MESIEKNNLVIIRLSSNEDFNDMLIRACTKHKIKTDFVISCIGQLKYSKLGYFKKKGDYCPQEFKKPLEIISINGNIIFQEEEYLLHLHAILGDRDKKTYGGHFIDGIISVTAEIVLLKSDVNIKRIFDKETGLKSLILE